MRLCFSVVKPVRDARLADLKVKVNHENIYKNVGGLFEKVCMVQIKWISLHLIRSQSNDSLDALGENNVTLAYLGSC